MAEHPFIVKQTAEPEHTRTPEAQREWMEGAWAEAVAVGGRWPRYSIRTSPVPMLLFECWAERPADEGPQRWSLRT